MPTSAATGDRRVSVIVPVRDGERYLAETLDSIVNQTLMPHEIIVVDDGSQDSSAAIAKSFGDPVQVIMSEPIGGAARDLGVRKATGELVALCDADDLWMPDKLAQQVALIPDVDQPKAVFCAATEFISPELSVDSLRTRDPMDHIERAQISSALLATRTALDAVGPFHSEDDDGLWFSWCVRLSDAPVTVAYARDVLVKRRLHDRNQSLDTPLATAMWTTTLHAHLRRRREDQE